MPKFLHREVMVVGMHERGVRPTHHDGGRVFEAIVVLVPAADVDGKYH